MKTSKQVAEYLKKQFWIDDIIQAIPKSIDAKYGMNETMVRESIYKVVNGLYGKFTFNHVNLEYTKYGTSFYIDKVVKFINWFKYD